MYDSLSRYSLCHFFWLFCLFSSSTWAQTIQELLWKIPDGSQPDFSSTFTEGNTVPLAWNELVTTSYVDTTKTLVDLWATAYDATVNSFALRIRQNVNLTAGGGSFSWTIDIPESSLDTDAKYVLRFKAAGSTYDPNTGELSSPGLLILKAAAASSSSSSSSLLPPSTTSSSSLLSSIPATTTAPTSPSSTSQSVPTTSQPPSSGGLSAGAKAGIAVGAAVVAIGLIALLYFLLVRGKKNRANVASSIPQMDYKYEVPASDAQELQGTRQTNPQVAELG